MDDGTYDEGSTHIERYDRRDLEGRWRPRAIRPIGRHDWLKLEGRAARGRLV